MGDLPKLPPAALSEEEPDEEDEDRGGGLFGAAFGGGLFGDARKYLMGPPLLLACAGLTLVAFHGAEFHGRRPARSLRCTQRLMFGDDGDDSAAAEEDHGDDDGIRPLTFS